jgi:phosphoglucosamine mutase
MVGKLFGTSGVRGVINKDITPELAIDLGLALATHLKNSGTVVVGKDPRTSSDMLESCLISGLLSGGCDVKRLSIVPTPAVSFAIRFLNADSGIMITASHNPPEYNGMKFWNRDGMAYTTEQEAKIETIYYSKKLSFVTWDKIGKFEDVDVLPGYMDEITSDVSLSRSYKVVLDCGNGAGALVTPYLLRKLGCKVITLNSQVDGFFPGRGLEPTPENLGELCNVVKSIGADIGFAHDGDADRIAAVDEKGRVANPDKLLSLISAHQLKKEGDIVITTVDASDAIDESVGEKKGKVVRTSVGDVSVAVEVKRRGAIFGGEPCGAWIFPTVTLAPDGPLAAAKILELLDSSGKSLSELLDSIPEHPTVRKKITCPNEKKPTVMKKFKAELRKEFRGIRRVLTIDGVRFSFIDGTWVLVRPSGTEPCIRITAGGKKENDVRKIVEETSRILKSLLVKEKKR